MKRGLDKSLYNNREALLYFFTKLCEEFKLGLHVNFFEIRWVAALYIIEKMVLILIDKGLTQVPNILK